MQRATWSKEPARPSQRGRLILHILHNLAFANKHLRTRTKHAATAHTKHHQRSLTATRRTIISFPPILATQPLHFCNKHGLALYLPVFSLQLLNQGHAVPLLLVPLLFQIFPRYFILRLVPLLGRPVKNRAYQRQTRARAKIQKLVPHRPRSVMSESLLTSRRSKSCLAFSRISSR